MAARPAAAVPFDPVVPPERISKLKRLLEEAELPAETFESSEVHRGERNFGVATKWMQEALDYWRGSFDWSKSQDRISSVPHFKTQVQQGGDSFDVHYIASFSSNPRAIPLLLLHGWPGSFLEFVDVFKILAADPEETFTIIAPSQPGYGFSSTAPLTRDFGLYDVAELMNNLMKALGFHSYAAQGGDIGSVIARILAVKHEECKAININYLPLAPPSSLLPLYLPKSIADWIPEVMAGSTQALLTPLFGAPATHGLTERQKSRAKQLANFASTGRGYGIMHGTRPATIGIAIQSSPVALLAWLGEKLQEWTDDTPSFDVILELVTMWWALESFPKSIYPYRHIPAGVAAWHMDPKLYVTKPMGFSSFQYEIASAPKHWAELSGNLQYYNFHERGGHFAAMEQPEAFATDMIECFKKLCC